MSSVSPPESALKLEEIRENFKFLAAEISGQIQATSDLLEAPSEKTLHRICSRDDYIDNLKTTIENACFSRIHGQDPLGRDVINVIRSIHIICVNLERIADFCVNTARQMVYLSDPAFIRRFGYAAMIQEIQQSIARVVSVFDERSLSGALDICRSEFVLDTLYKSEFDRIMMELDTGKSSRDLVTTLFIFRYLERIGDSLLNIGEALLFVILGEKIKIHQFEALQKTLSASGYDEPISEIDIESIWGSRSGCRIRLVVRKEGNREKSRGIFKEGDIGKIRKEKISLERWEHLFPGLTPRIFGYHEHHDVASMLVEYLPGCTLDEVILTASDSIVSSALVLLKEVIYDIWKKTLKRDTVAVTSIQQLLSRLEGSRRLHPELFRREKRMGGVEIPSTDAVIRRCADVERTVSAPFSVLCHGDFNSNNLVYDHPSRKLHYIDVYRSHPDDYVQDAAVFLISNFRTPVFDPVLRSRLNTVIFDFLDWVNRFAREHGDTSCPIRMALALSRHFYTSIRFEHHDNFAREMSLRAHYLMEKIIHHPSGKWESFSFPEDILRY